eukprot:PhM_4_TR16835/c0_g1_i1/m.100022
MATQSLLTTALHAHSGERADLISSKEYGKARELRTEILKSVEEQKRLDADSQRRRHDIENEKLKLASKIAIQQLDAQCDAKVTELEGSWDEKRQHLREKHERELRIEEERVRAKEASRRNIHSSYVRDLQRAEKRLADLHLYEDCAMTRHKIVHLEKEELQEMERAKEKRIETALQRLRQKQEAEMRFLETRMRNGLVIAKTDAHSKKQVNHYRFQNKDLQMQHAHAVERNERVNLEAYHRPNWIRLPERDRQAATSRGSQVFQQQVGDKYDIPSLCDLYGNKTQEELCPPIPASRRNVLLY